MALAALLCRLESTLLPHSYRPPLSPTAPPPFPSRLLSVISASFEQSLPRPSLDDVERLSRGDASKAKIGSRAVPHRLTAGERKAYELAKRKGFLVQHARSRRYPLSNTFRNYCDAIGWPCLRIDQGEAGIPDTVVIDLTTLRLGDKDLSEMCRTIYKAIGSMLVLPNDVSLKTSWTHFQTNDIADLSNSDICIKQGFTSIVQDYSNSEKTLEGIGDASYQQKGTSAGVLKLLASRDQTKQICQAVLNCCKSLCVIKAKKIVM